MAVAVAGMALALIVLAFIGLAVYGGFVLYILWGWFLVPLGVPQIGIAWAIGISCVAGLLMPTVPTPEREEKKFEHIISILLKPAMALIVGFVAKSFM